jgi:hypothetical protein
MTDFVEKLHLKEAAEEDLYFARRDRELLKALHEKRLAQEVECPEDGDSCSPERFERRFQEVSAENHEQPHKLASAYRALLGEIRRLCRVRRGG